jgi:hypothetical protein
MGLETKVLNSINDTFESKGLQPPKVWFEYGTLWADTENPMGVRFIKESIEKVVISNHNNEVEVTKFEPTKREPWTQWAFDF